MITRFACLALIVLALLAGCAASPDVPAVEYHDALAEASCGQCQLGLAGSGCNLAVRIDGESYYVDGFGIDDHGDAHASDGMCNAIRAARVTGRIEDGRFVATSFELVPDSDD